MNTKKRLFQRNQHLRKKVETQTTAFLGLSWLPFGGSTVLSLTRGPGNRPHSTVLLHSHNGLVVLFGSTLSLLFFDFCLRACNLLPTMCITLGWSPAAFEALLGFLLGQP